LGLIYEVRIDEEQQVEIDMTLTSPNCPVAETLPKEVEDKVASVEHVKSAKVNIVFDPPWDKDMMSEEAKLELGFL
jgi:metal-sulfur cluster biosynthetic enzyme